MNTSTPRAEFSRAAVLESIAVHQVGHQGRLIVITGQAEHGQAVRTQRAAEIVVCGGAVVVGDVASHENRIGPRRPGANASASTLRNETAVVTPYIFLASSPKRCGSVTCNSRTEVLGDPIMVRVVRQSRQA